ncbi:helix-turn-helix domain-containing protein [Trinickia caryophylli]|nr:XRE family transcriptional regulator [Trinickia caryophylli]TRX15379.1 helix-turn-helix domain-containing protein [Trinickia caryophylli]
MRPHGASERQVGTLAQTLRRLRTHAHLTLQQLGERSSISVSTLSKIENGQLSPTYEKIAALAIGLGVEVSELFNQTPKPVPLGRRSITKAGSGVVHETDQYVYEVLNADLAGKRFVPLFTTIKAHSIGEFRSLLRHDGEEFLYVLEGTVIVNTEFYAPSTLSKGDAMYFDSTMGHACISGTDEDAKVLWVCSHVTLD